LLIDLDRGLLLVHLGMSGSLGFSRHSPPLGVHDHFEMITTHGTLKLNDPRRFGAVVYAKAEDAPNACKLLGKLGMEPLSDDFEVDQFHAGLKRRKAAIKQVLLAGDVVVGVGNIYASETLFLAGIRPTLSAARLSRPRAAKLHAAIQDVLARAVAGGGSTLRDFSSATGESGHFQLEAMVYARGGQACRVCGTAVKSLRQGQRSTFYCPHCQRA
jgi:formamidopyrimidine-DNA glycosylase